MPDVISSPLPDQQSVPGEKLTPPLSTLAGGAGGGGLLSRDRVRMVLDGREPDRVPLFDIYSGEPTAAPGEFPPRTTPESDLCLLSADLTPRYPIRVLEQDGETIVQTTSYGGVCRDSANRSVLPKVVDYAVKSRADWEYVVRRLEVTPDRVDWGVAKPAYDQARTAGRCVAFAAPVGFAVCAAYSGAGAALDMLGADPGLIHDMADAHTGLLCGMAEALIAGGCRLDLVLLFDDLADRRGLLFSPQRYRRSFAPVARRLTDFFHGLGLKVILYSGGDVRPLIPDLIDTGLDGLGPLEVAAGMDLPVLKLTYGAALSFLGGIDRRALQNPDPAVLEREIAVKLRAGMVRGRYIAGFDGPLPLSLPAEHWERATDLLTGYGRY